MTVEQLTERAGKETEQTAKELSAVLKMSPTQERAMKSAMRMAWLTGYQSGNVDASELVDRIFKTWKNDN